MSQPYLGEIRAFGFNFAPRNWAFCNGSILQIRSNTALFSILGTTYGGNGTTTFGLPNLNGSVAVGAGQGPGLSPYALGEVTGVNSVTLLITEIPAHSHTPLARVQPGTAAMHTVPEAGDYMSRFNASSAAIGLTWNNPPLENAGILSPTAIGVTGGSQPHENRQPFQVINYCICTQGVFPARN